jgi:trigger factor
MKVSIDSKKGLKTKLQISVDKTIIDKKIASRLEELSKTVNMKGFRPGKVPVDVLKRQFGKAVYGEVLENILKETSTKAIEDKKMKVAGQPKLDLTSHGEGKDLQYTLEVDELPNIKLQPIENIKFNDYEIKITDSNIKKRIDDIAKNQDNFKDKKENERATNGDMVFFDYLATIDGKNFEGGEGKNTQIVLGKDLFIKGFDENIKGVKKNDEKNIESILPENYPKKEFANKKAIFKCKILNIKSPEPTKIDDQFAKNLGTKDLNDLKKLVEKQMQDQYKTGLDAIAKENILEQIEKLHSFDLPKNLIQQELSIMTQGLKDEELDKNKIKVENIAKKRIKLGLVLNEFGEKNNLKVNEQELRAEIQKQVQSMPGQQKQVLEYYQKNPSATSSLRGSIYEDKIINFIKQKAKKIIKNISSDEAENILKSEHEKKHKDHDHAKKESSEDTKKTVIKKSKKAVKTITKNKKIRKK